MASFALLMEEEGETEMGTRKGQLHLALSVQGAGYSIGSWRQSSAKPGKLHDAAYYYRLAQTAEQGKLDLLFLDSASAGERLRATGKEPGLPLEPFTLLGGVASVTRRIGLGAAVSASALEPFGVARQLAALDHLSGGRLAWQPIPQDSRELTCGLGTQALSPSEQESRLQEFIEVAELLWNSWEEGAVIANRETGRYIDSSKVHLIQHAGKHFRVRGPLSIPRSPQGQPVRIAASAASAYQQAADLDSAELVFSYRPSLEEAIEFRAALRQRIASRGRTPDAVKVLATVSPILGTTEEEARHKAAELYEWADPEIGRAYLSDWLNEDLADYPLDTDSSRIPGLREAVEAVNLPHAALREHSRRALALTGTHIFIGTPQQLADWMEAWHAGNGCDGFHLQLPLLRGELDDLVAHVIPELQRRGLYRTEYAGNTLRDHLDLPNPGVQQLAKEG
ncbi:NtaA/DmoA family FMN-dependent monooxygenase [Paenibacillaceae bacterium WGS1546]|uniref:NtaA/DmoA family FMN-dependent monooxygenase n=1 Tax=Cohnella sp. WGS1546 TaxID=3366810 RepID=UPI00372D36A6